MRILQISQRPQRRGAEVFAYQLSGELRRRGHDVCIVYLYNHQEGSVLPLSPGDCLLDGSEGSRLETLIGFHPSLLQRLKRLINEFNPDITQVNGARTIKYGILVQWLRNGKAGAVVYRNIGIPRDWVKGVRRKLFYRAINKRLAGIVAISRGSVEMLRPTFSAGTPCTVISNAVDPATLCPSVARVELRRAAQIPPTAPLAIYVGSLAHEKRVDRLISAVQLARAEVPDLHLWIVGEGPLRARLEQQVAAAELTEAIHFLGPQEDVASYLRASDFLALVSDTEGMPAVLLEAGYLDLPVVATRVGSVPECVLDGQTGLLVDRTDTDELVRSIVRLARDAQLREEMGRQAHQWVSQHYTIEHVATRYLTFYEGLLRNGRRE